MLSYALCTVSLQEFCAKDVHIPRFQHLASLNDLLKEAAMTKPQEQNLEYSKRHSPDLPIQTTETIWLIYVDHR